MFHVVEAEAAPERAVLKSHLGDEGRGADTLMWVQEEIFGHRFVEEQLPYMLVLEVLAICRVLQIGDDGQLFSEVRIFNHKAAPGEHEDFNIPIVRSVELRYILFKDRSLDIIANDQSISPGDRLERWIDELERGFSNEVKSVRKSFSYLRDRFEKFEAARQAVKIVKGLELDALNNRRYTSRFLAPRGPNLILNDVDLKFAADRMFFGRGGEMVYLMLTRSGYGTVLAEEIKSLFLSPNDPTERLVRRLTPGGADRTSGGPPGYLPLARHDAYRRMAEDWLAVLQLRSLPPPQKFEPLFRITALNLVRYFAERAMEVKVDGHIDPIPLDMTSGQNANLRDVSKIYFHRHRQVIDDAVEAFIRRRIESVASWQSAKEHTDAQLASDGARDTIANTFCAQKWKAKQSTGVKTPEQWLENFIRDAKKRDRNNISTMLAPLGRNAGFIVARRGVGTWFSASDEFLEALVLANVAGPVTVADFLQRLYERYGIVIGPAEQRRAFSEPPCDISAFEENLRELERRLTGLGYVKRLSDDCAFVSNVYSCAE